DRVGDLGRARAARLLGRLAHRRGPPRAALRRAVPAPDDDRPVGPPRHDDVDAELGRGLDRTLVAVTLGERLREGGPHRGRGLLAPVEHRELEAARRHALDDALEPHARAVGHVDALAGPTPLHDTRVPGLGPLEHVPVAGPVPVQQPRTREEDGRCRRHRPASLSRSLANTPLETGARRAGGRSSPRSSASRRSSSTCSSSSPVGTWTSTCTCRSPRPPTCSRPTPRPFSTTTAPGWVPGATST